MGSLARHRQAAFSDLELRSSMAESGMASRASVRAAVCDHDEVVLVKGTGERVSVGCHCGADGPTHASDEALADKRLRLQRQAETLANGSHVADPLELARFIDEVLDATGYSRNGIVSETRDGITATYNPKLTTYRAPERSAERFEFGPGGVLKLPAGATEAEMDRIMAQADSWKVHGNIPPSAAELGLTPPPVALTADAELAEGLRSKERQRWLQRAAEDLTTDEVRLPTLRPAPRVGALFPDRHPKLHRILRRFGPYRDRQLRRLNAWYEERPRIPKPGVMTRGRGIVDFPGWWEMR